jgi:hypothetical protein
MFGLSTGVKGKILRVIGGFSTGFGLFNWGIKLDVAIVKLEDYEETEEYEETEDYEETEEELERR